MRAQIIMILYTRLWEAYLNPCTHRFTNKNIYLTIIPQVFTTTFIWQSCVNIILHRQLIPYFKTYLIFAK